MLSRSRFEGELKALGLIDSRPESSSAAGLKLSDPGPNPKTAQFKSNAGSAVRSFGSSLTRYRAATEWTWNRRVITGACL